MRSSYLALPLGVSIALLAGCSTLTPTDDPVYLRLQDLEARVIRIERVVNNESLIQIANQLDQLRAETQALRGEVETLRFETESGAERQRQLYLDIDQRLQALESQGRAGLGGANQGFGANAAPGAGGLADAGGDGAPRAGAPSGGAQQAAISDEASYQAAFEQLQARRYQDAARAFTQFLQMYPDSPLADNAQYWLAETHYVQRQFAAALPEFQKVIDSYPQSDKLADALLKVGYCNYELEQWDAARTALQTVMRDYPGTTAAQLAISRLEVLEREAG